MLVAFSYESLALWVHSYFQLSWYLLPGYALEILSFTNANQYNEYPCIVQAFIFVNKPEVAAPFLKNQPTGNV